MHRRCRSRCVGASAAVPLGTAPLRGGTTTVASGWRSATAPYTSSRSYAPSPVNEATESSTWSSNGPTREASSVSWPVSSTASIRLVSASTPRCSFRQARRVRVPCFPTSHSPGPPSFSPVLSTSRCSGPPLPERGRGTSRVAARRDRVVWSGTASSSPSRRKIEPISPSVWRKPRRNTARSVRAVRIARGEYQGCPPRVVRGSARQARITSWTMVHTEVACRATVTRSGSDAEYDPDGLVVHFDPPDQGADDVALRRPIRRFQTVLDDLGKGLDLPDDEREGAGLLRGVPDRRRGRFGGVHPRP